MAQIQQQQVFVQYVDQYGNPIPVVPMGHQQQPIQVVMPIQQQHKMSVASNSSLHSNPQLHYPPPGQIPLQIQPPTNPAAHQNIERSIQIQQAIQNQADGTANMPMPQGPHKSKQRRLRIKDRVASSGPHKGLLCCVFQCTQLTVGVCKNRFCGDSCCTEHEEQHCFRPAGKNECDCICCLIYLLLLCCIWEAFYNCLIAQICRKENKWCCIPCDLFVNLLLFFPLMFAALIGDILCVLFATLACVVDPLCFLLTCNGEFCAWTCGHNALCCCTLGWYENDVTDPKQGCWEDECGDDCGYFYCYRLRCDNWNIC